MAQKIKTIITNLDRLRVPKRKCKNCSKYSDRDKMFIRGVMAFCDVNCAAQWGFKNKDKGANKLRLEKKRAFRQTDLKTRKSAAIKACHEYIRERDKHKGCITCGKPLVGTKFDAGHFLKSTHSYTKFMEKNIHGQCVACNQYRGGEEKIYESKIKEIYGLRTLEALYRCKSKAIKRTAEDYKAIENYYKEKLKEIKDVF